MSYHYYIKDETKKLLVDCGGSINENSILEDFKIYAKFKDELNDLCVDDIDEKEYRKLTIQDLKILFKCQKIIEDLQNIITRTIACVYWWMNNENNKLEIIGEDKLKDLKEYKIIE